MSFLFRFLFVVGLIYAISPAQPGLPAWMEKTVTAASVSTSVEGRTDLIQSVMQLTMSACKSHPDACVNAVQVTASIENGSADFNNLMNELSEIGQEPNHSKSETPDEPEATGSIAEHTPLPPRRTPETGHNKKI